jgi:hypothetical protein
MSYKNSKEKIESDKRVKQLNFIINKLQDKIKELKSIKKYIQLIILTSIGIYFK